MISIRGRMVRLAGSALIASVGLTLASAPAAHAATKKSLAINTTCLGFFINTDPSAEIGSTGGAVPPEKLFNLPITVAAVGGPTEVNAGSTFNGTAASVAVPIPEFVDTGITGLGIGIDGNGVVPVHAAANITETIQVVGAASVGTPSFAGGGNVVGATVTKIGSDKIKVVFPGTKTTSSSDFPLPPANTQTITGDEHEFTAPSTFTTPSLKIPVTAGAAGTKVQFKLVSSTNPHSSDFGNFQIDSDVDAFGTGDHIPIRAFCDPNGQLLGKVQVVSPPPPGAPDAVADVATTDQGAAVNVDVTANDTANAVLAINEDSLAVTKSAAHGTTTRERGSHDHVHAGRRVLRYRRVHVQVVLGPRGTHHHDDRRGHPHVGRQGGHDSVRHRGRDGDCPRTAGHGRGSGLDPDDGGGSS